MKELRRNTQAKYLLFAFTCICMFLSSCGSKKSVVYNPAQVKQLSNKMGISIQNNDPHIPLYAEVSMWLGVPYRYAGTNERGIDCSGLVYRVYQNLYKKKVSRSSAGLAKETRSVSKNNLLPGDLVFFATTSNKKKISHVGIYLKDGYFAHSSTRRGVIISHLDENYYKQRWKTGGRLK
ncbi:NlpC/P60 family protein [Dysgonomonas sp. 216]|uniref:C40 family peptidase n=1 Tax=Dysgonomonas sp. 216 TaxID=2302934 RepID=UPI0013D02236|nr:NlpC/P60 family protein [Dysgonomonas sp. 216]NDW18504.1 NlpC/P60 family protein [Dysgonomonas sp. 216]